jgi:uncharacterized DUF497 family protein
MNFEWNEEKNEENIRKHHLDFADAREIFEAPMLVGIDARKDYGEIRQIGIVFLKNFIVVIVFTEQNNDIIRIISLRKALRYEREKFERKLRNELGTAEDDF